MICRILPVALIICAPSVVSAQAIPQFKDRSAALPAHIYGGGWEHFVGGGVATFDCNNDGMTDLFAAGGENPRKPDDQPLNARREFEFRAQRDKRESRKLPASPEPTRSTSTVTGSTDLAVLRVGANRLLKGLGDCAFEDASEDWGFDGGDRWTTAFTAGWEGRQRPPNAVLWQLRRPATTRMGHLKPVTSMNCTVPFKADGIKTILRTRLLHLIGTDLQRRAGRSKPTAVQ